MWQLPDDQFVRSFPTLPRIAALESQNPFPREDRVAFVEDGHAYFVDGIRVPRSVTGLVHSFAGHFDPARAIRCLKQGRNWEEKRAEMEAQELGISDEEIMSRWRRNGEAQSKRGQLLHHHAECLLNNVQIEEPHSPEFLQLRSIYRSLQLLGLKPIRTELCIFHCGLRLAGQIDALFLDQESKLVIVDWKRIRELKYENPHASLLYPLDNLPDTNYWAWRGHQRQREATDVRTGEAASALGAGRDQSRRGPPRLREGAAARTSPDLPASGDVPASRAVRDQIRNSHRRLREDAAGRAAPEPYAPLSTDIDAASYEQRSTAKSRSSGRSRWTSATRAARCSRRPPPRITNISRRGSASRATRCSP